MDGKEKTKRIRRHGFNAYIKQYKAMLEAERKAVGSHGSFAWSTDPYHAVHNSAVPEELAFMAFRTEAMPPPTSLPCSRICWASTTCVSMVRIPIMGKLK